MSSGIADDAWEAVLKRDHRYDGRFVYGVSSTSIAVPPVPLAVLLATM